MFEGGEGSGKTSLIRGLEKVLGDYNILWTYEPRDPALREALLKRTDFSPLAKMLLFYADRDLHLQQLVGPALAAGAHVICDRGHASTFAYQVFAEQGPYNCDVVFNCLDHAVVTKDLRPDHYFLLDVDPRIGLERVRRRGGSLTVFDQRSFDFHSQIRRGLRYYLESRALDRRTVVDASQPAEVVLEVVRTKLLELLPLNPPDRGA
jgi:dTMP kinase